MQGVTALEGLSDRELLARVKQLAQDERRTTADLVLHLSEVDARRLYLEEGCASIFHYCVEVLHLSEAAASNRIVAARAGRRFPAILEALERGELHLAAVRLLAPLLTVENHRNLVAAATHKSKREIAELVACIRPQPDVAASVRRLPVRSSNGASVHALAADSALWPSAAPATEPASEPVTGPGAAPTTTPVPERSTAPLTEPAPETSLTLLAPVPAAPSNQGMELHAQLHAQSHAQPPAPEARTGRVDPLSPGRYKVQFTASEETYDHLCKARELLRHRVPTGDVGTVMALALELLVTDLEKRKFGRKARQRSTAKRVNGSVKPDQPTKPSSPPDAPQDPAPERADANQEPSRRRSRHIPAAVKRAAWKRDGGRCTFTTTEGRRCTRKGRIEFDHRWPHADGGDPGLDNVRLLCRAHNQFEAQRFFGVWQAESAAHG